MHAAKCEHEGVTFAGPGPGKHVAAAVAGAAARTPALRKELDGTHGDQGKQGRAGSRPGASSTAQTSVEPTYAQFRPTNHKASRFQNCFGQDPRFFGNFMKRI